MLPWWLMLRASPCLALPRLALLCLVCSDSSGSSGSWLCDPGRCPRVLAPTLQSLVLVAALVTQVAGLVFLVAVLVPSVAVLVLLVVAPSTLFLGSCEDPRTRSYKQGFSASTPPQPTKKSSSRKKTKATYSIAHIATVTNLILGAKASPKKGVDKNTKNPSSKYKPIKTPNEI